MWELMSISKAKEEEILDEKNNIQQDLKVQNSLWDNVTKNMESWKDWTELSISNLDNITAETEIQKTLQKEISDILERIRQKQLQRLRGLGGYYNVDEGVFTSRKTGLSYSTAFPEKYDKSFNDNNWQGMQQSFASNQAYLDSLQESSTISEKSQNLGMSQAPTGTFLDLFGKSNWGK